MVSLVSAVACLGVIGYAVAHNRARSKPEPEPVVMTAPVPKPVYVDVRTLAAVEPRREPEVPAPSTSTPPADEVPLDVARGTGVIAVKKGGKAKVAKVAAVADKPLDPNHAPFSPARQSAGPRVYGETLAGYGGSGGRDSGATIRESSHGFRAGVGGIR